MFVQYLEKDISHINRAPQIVKQDTGFFEFIKNICTYCEETALEIYKILDNVRPVYSINNESNIIFLKRLLEKCGILLQWLPETFTNEELTEIYKMAIQGFVVLRNTDSTPKNLKQIIGAIFGISEEAITIEESYSSSSMSYTATISGINQPIQNNYLAQYIKPNITGVLSFLQFNTQGYFVCMRVNEQNEEISINDNNYESLDGSLCWMDVENSDKEISVIDKTNYPASTGFWAVEYK